MDINTKICENSRTNERSDQIPDNCKVSVLNVQNMNDEEGNGSRILKHLFDQENTRENENNDNEENNGDANNSSNSVSNGSDNNDDNQNGATAKTTTNTTNNTNTTNTTNSAVLEAAEYFIPLPALRAIYSGSLQSIAEIRHVTSLFLRLDSYFPEMNLDPITLQPFFFLLQTVLMETGGFLRQFLVDDKVNFCRVVAY